MNPTANRPFGARAARILCAIAVAFVAATAVFAGTAQASPGDPTKYYNWTDLDYSDKNIIGEPLKEGEPAMSPPMILMLMNFAIVLFIIGWKVKPPVLGYVKQRHQSIKDALEEASRLRKEAQAKLDEYNDKLAAAEKEVEQIISDIRASAKAEKERIMKDAEFQAEAMKKDAETRIAAEIARAREELEREVIAVAIAAAEKLLRERTTQKDHTSLIESFIHDVRASDKSKEERA